MKIHPSLLPIVKHLQETLHCDVYGFDAHNEGQANCICWYYNGKVLSIQTNPWYDKFTWNDIFDVSVSIVPSLEHGSSYSLSNTENGLTGEEILKNLPGYLAHIAPPWFKQYGSIEKHNRFYTFYEKL